MISAVCEPAGGKHAPAGELRHDERRQDGGVPEQIWRLSNILVLGPYSGKLDNSAESVKLYKPDTSDPTVFGSYVLVDEVEYRMRHLAPAADGLGASFTADRPGAIRE